MSTTVEYSPLDPVVQEDPYPFYAELRRGPSATYLGDDDLWVVPRFEHVREVVRSPELYSSIGVRALAVGAVSARFGERPDLRDLDSRLAAMLVTTDPPDHSRLRRLVSKPFTPRMLARFAEPIRASCHEAVDDLLAASERGEADLARDFNVPVPIQAIASALGVPTERREDFKRWSDAVAGQLDGGPVRAGANEDIVEMSEFFAEVIVERSTNPGDDIVSWIINGSSGSDTPLTVKELVMFATLLLVAGNETTTNLLGNAATAFFRDEDQFNKMRQAPDLTPVVEEALRYDSPIQTMTRLVNDDLQLGDTTIPKDSVVLVLFGSANHDETRWEDPDRFDIERKPLDHLAFGSGIHHCLGAHLARLVTATSLDVWRTRLRTLEPAGPPTRLHSSIIRGLTSIPVNAEPT